MFNISNIGEIITTCQIDRHMCNETRNKCNSLVLNNMKYIRFDLDFVVQQISYKSCRYPSLNTDKTTQDISIVAGQR